MLNRVMIGAILLGAASAPASAFFIGTRFVERIGNTDVVLGESVTFTAGSTHRLRMQFGVFDDADGPAPSGGYLGWNDGTFSANFGSWTRTPGRMVPFIFSRSPTANGSPVADPFTDLTLIDNTLGFWALQWHCGPDGQPLPPPPPTPRGLNEYISTYEVTVQIPADLEGTFGVTIGGHVLGVVWDFNESLSSLPDCDNGEPGVAFWGPLATPPREFTDSLQVNVVIPAPAGTACLLGGMVMWGRRKRA